MLSQPPWKRNTEPAIVTVYLLVQGYIQRITPVESVVFDLPIGTMALSSTYTKVTFSLL